MEPLPKSEPPVPESPADSAAGGSEPQVIQPHGFEQPAVIQPASAGHDSPVHPMVYPSATNPSLSPTSNRPAAVVEPLSDHVFVVGGGPAVPPPVIGKIKKPWFKRLAIILPVLVVLVLLGGGAAAYFGYYVPNKPENIWNTALERTGQGLDKLTSYADNELGGQYKGVAVKGSFKVSGDLTADASFQGSTSGGNSQFTGSLSAGGVKANLDLRTIKTSSSTAPDLYIKVSGLDGLSDLLGGYSGLGSAISGVNDHWYFVDHSLFEQYESLLTSGGKTPSISSADIKSLVNQIAGPTKTYIFTSDPQTAVLTLKEVVGKEQQDGRTVYHYKAGINKTNLKAYNNAVCDAIKDNKIFTLASSGQDMTAALKDCKDTSDIDSIKDSTTLDVWVDTHTKLVHRVRFTDQSGSGSFWDVGQDYQGGDAIPFFLDVNSKDGSTNNMFHMTLTLNQKTGSLAVGGSFKSIDGGSGNTNGSFDLNVMPTSGPVNVQKPANAKNILQLLNDLGLGQYTAALANPVGTYGGVQQQARDTERKTDINALQGQIEAYNAENGYYPTLADLNNPSWISANFKGLDTQALKDPSGSSTEIAAKPSANVYAYQVTPAGCDDTTVQCTAYTLTATLEAGGTYSKTSLN